MGYKCKQQFRKSKKLQIKFIDLSKSDCIKVFYGGKYFNVSSTNFNFIMDVSLRKRMKW